MDPKKQNTATNRIAVTMMPAFMVSIPVSLFGGIGILAYGGVVSSWPALVAGFLTKVAGIASSGAGQQALLQKLMAMAQSGQGDVQ